MKYSSAGDCCAYGIHAMEITKFHRNKYGQELLIDAGRISDNVNLIVNDNAFSVDFFEIFLICK
ncbi:MAG: hypothetical protein AAFV07_11475, partial [Bacteroidota bacterium]